METKVIRYCFQMPDNSREIFKFELNAKNLDLKDSVPKCLPPWTKLESHQCSNCPLDAAAHPYCPLAANIYQNMQTVNCAIAQRLREATANDSSVNAIVILDSFAQIVPFAIEESLEELRYLFSPHSLKI